MLAIFSCECIQFVLWLISSSRRGVWGLGTSHFTAVVNVFLKENAVLIVHPEKQQHVSQHAHCLKTGWLPRNGKRLVILHWKCPLALGVFA